MRHLPIDGEPELESTDHALAEKFGATVQRLVPSPDRQRVLGQRRKLMERAAARGLRPRRGLYWFAWASVATALVAVVLAARWFRAPAELAFESGSGEKLQVGEHLTSPSALGAGEEERLSVSDGTHILLASHSDLELLRAENSEAELRLHHGQITSSVRPEGGIRWSIHAGPYRVLVVGTQFVVSWEPEKSHFDLSVTHGTVRVFGVDLPREGQLVATGETLARDPKPEPTPVTDPAPGTPGEDEPEPATEGEPATALAGAATSKPSRGPASTAGEADWRRLARAGNYAAAFAKAQEDGLTTVVAGATSPWDLILLSDTARITGHSDPARTALLEIRKRFTTHPAATVSAFSLGRLASDLDRNPALAIRWFQTYLNESSGAGELSENARGRLLALYVQIGNQTAARRMAREYISHHSAGPQAEVARRILGEDHKDQ